MDTKTIAEYALLLVAAIRQLIAARQDATPLLDEGEAKIREWVATGTDPTQADFDALNARQQPKEDMLAASAKSDDGA